jgi:hypothetical protein
MALLCEISLPFLKSFFAPVCRFLNSQYNQNQIRQNVFRKSTNKLLMIIFVVNYYLSLSNNDIIISTLAYLLQYEDILNIIWLQDTIQ